MSHSPITRRTLVGVTMLGAPATLFTAGSASAAPGEEVAPELLPVASFDEVTAATTTTAATAAEVEAEFLRAMNVYRQKLRRAGLTRADALQKVASKNVATVAKRGTPGHPGSPYAENSGMIGGDYVRTSSAAVLAQTLLKPLVSEPHSYDEWVASGRNMDMFMGTGKYSQASGHRINTENPESKQTGVAVAFTHGGTRCFVQIEFA